MSRIVAYARCRERFCLSRTALWAAIQMMQSRTDLNPFLLCDYSCAREVGVDDSCDDLDELMRLMSEEINTSVAPRLSPRLTCGHRLGEFLISANSRTGQDSPDSSKIAAPNDPLVVMSSNKLAKESRAESQTIFLHGNYALHSLPLKSNPVNKLRTWSCRVYGVSMALSSVAGATEARGRRDRETLFETFGLASRCSLPAHDFSAVERHSNYSFLFVGLARMGAIDRGVEYFSLWSGLRTKAPPAPPISESTAILCSALFTILDVAPFYLSHTLRITPLSGRDAPSVIKARVGAVLVTCLVCSVITAFVLLQQGHVTLAELLRLTGLWPVQAIDVLKVISLVAILFIGPLYETLLVDGEWRSLSIAGLRAYFWDSWIGYRNLIVAPASEELVFRSLTISLHLVAGVNPVRIVFLTPLIFGLAHIHHLVEFINAHTMPGRRFASSTVWIRGITRSLFQFIYTSLFGFFEAFVFLRTGNLWAAILAHTFCNSMGFPRVWGQVGEAAAHHDTTPDLAQGKKSDDAKDEVLKVGNSALLPDSDAPTDDGSQWSSSSRFRLTFVYYFLLVAGALAFYNLLWVLTASENALASFS